MFYDYCSIECICLIKESIYRVIKTKLVKPLLLFNLTFVWHMSALNLV